MAITVKKQFVDFEIFEFKNEGIKSVDDIIADFNNFPWKEELEKSKKRLDEHAFPKIQLTNSKKHKLSISMEDNGKFSVIYFEKSVIYRLMSCINLTQDQVIEIIEVFNTENSKHIKMLMRKRSYYSNSLLQNISSAIFSKEIDITLPYQRQIEFHYAVSSKQILKKFSWTLFYLLMPSAFVLLAVFERKSIDMKMMLIMQAMLMPLAIPGIVILINYLKKNHLQKLVFKKGENLFYSISGNKKEIFDKKDIKSRMRIDSSANNAPWTSFEYSVLIMKDGSKIFLSNILMDYEDVNKQFSKVKEEYESKWIPTIRNK
jgi:hypothetical protein